MNPKTITFASFVDRIANVLGLQISGAEGERQIKINLGLAPALLVLDNADAFEDAVDRDEATQISNFISHITVIPGVTVMLTSRTSSNARRVSWTQFDVPPLEREPARLSFRRIYLGKSLMTRSMDSYTAKENRWSGKVLLDRWRLQQGKLLQRGDGKDNLAFTIRLSLESPSVRTLGDEALRVLSIVAFFPQGINQDHLTRLFPALHSQIFIIVDTLCKISLLYPSAPFLTMLAPYPTIPA
ncbi:hypothetical protein JVU11DRAFT_7347 [Chiua virens]|nr:hypothetical protein JVU11DRAFT_7347 [Chiua virens]